MLLSGRPFVPRQTMRKMMEERLCSPSARFYEFQRIESNLESSHAAGGGGGRAWFRQMSARGWVR